MLNLVTNIWDEITYWWSDLTKGEVTEVTVMHCAEDIEAARAVQQGLIEENMNCTLLQPESVCFYDKDGNPDPVAMEPGVIVMVSFYEGGLLRGPRNDFAKVYF